MAGKMISELSDAITLQSTDLIPLARGALTLRIAGSAIGASTIISDTPLTGVSNGQLWFDSSSGITSIYYDSTWVDVGGGDSANSLNVVDSPTIDLSYNSSTGTLSADITGKVPNVNGGAGTLTGILKATAGVVSAAVAGTDYATEAQGAKAWVVFDGGAATILLANSYNVTSITDNGVGNYNINFVSGTFSSTNYLTLGYADDVQQNYKPGFIYIGPDNTRTVNTFQIYLLDTYSNRLWDCPRVQIAFFE